MLGGGGGGGGGELESVLFGGCNREVALLYLGNHKQIILETEHPDVREYRYYEKKSRGLDYQGMLEDLKVRRNQTSLLHWSLGV